jgi:hypothetical protein
LAGVFSNMKQISGTLSSWPQPPQVRKENMLFI